MPDTDFTKFASLIKNVVKEELKPLSKQVAGISEQVAGISEQVAYLTERVDGEIIPTLENHTQQLNKLTLLQEKDNNNILKLDKRLSETEAKLGIQAPPEHQIIQ